MHTTIDDYYINDITNDMNDNDTNDMNNNDMNKNDMNNNDMNNNDMNNNDMNNINYYNNIKNEYNIINYSDDYDYISFETISLIG
jgi:hypothetical protein